MSREKLVEVKNLKTVFQLEGQTAKAIDGLDFDIYKGEILGIVGESGSGKSVTSLSLIQLIPNPPGDIVEGQILFNNEKIFDGDERQKVMEYPEYRFFDRLKGSIRNILMTAVFIGWILFVLNLPVFGFWIKTVSIIAGLIGFGYTFISSPRKKQYRKFREKLFKRIRDIRGREIAMIFQEPMTSLNPVFTVGMQIIEAIETKDFFDFLKDWVISSAQRTKRTQLKNRLRISAITAMLSLFFSQLIAGWTFHLSSIIMAIIIGSFVPVIFSLIVIGISLLISKKYKEKTTELFKKGIKLIDLVGIPDPEQRLHEYPHQFSGGMRQRAMIAMSLAKNPSLLIADEPTTALDVTIQAQILDLMKDVKNQRDDAAIVLITHDLAVVAEMCERVIVMYGGKIQEVAEIKELFKNPLHPYTRGLLNSIPNPTRERKGRLQAIRGMVPNILSFPPGCKFCTRCDDKLEYCDSIEPDLIEKMPGHFVRCHLYQQTPQIETD